MNAKKSYPILTAEEAVMQISDGDMVAFSGFTSAGAAKVIPKALATRAKDDHQKGLNFKIKVLTGASSSEAIDKDLAEANAEKLAELMGVWEELNGQMVEPAWQPRK